MAAYGIQNSQEAVKLLRTAHEHVESVLLKGVGLRLPDEILQLGLAQLLVAASADDKSTISEWSCLLLKVCHAVAHAKWTRDEDAYEAAFTKVKTRLQSFVVEARDGIWIGDKNCRIPLIDYRLKSGKEFFRIVTKLLLKQGNLSAGIYDHIGVWFVTSDIFSAILLIKFLGSRHVLMYANLLPQESRNSIAEFQWIEQLFAEFCPPVQYLRSL